MVRNWTFSFSVMNYTVKRGVLQLPPIRPVFCTAWLRNSVRLSFMKFPLRKDILPSLSCAVICLILKRSAGKLLMHWPSWMLPILWRNAEWWQGRSCVLWSRVPVTEILQSPARIIRATVLTWRLFSIGQGSPGILQGIRIFSANLLLRCCC